VDIAVVIPTFRRIKPLRRALMAIARQTRRPDAVLVVARPGDTATEEVALSVRDDLPTSIVDVCRPGLVAALNAGLDAAVSEVVAFTDDDAEPHADWLLRIEDVLRSDPRIAAVGGRDWVYYDGRLVEGSQPVVGHLSWYGRVTGNHHWGSGDLRDVYVLKGVNMAFRRQPLSEVRFDGRLLGVGVEYHSELGACLKLRARGWRIVYDPSIGVDHRPAPRVEGRRELDDERLIRCAAHNETLAILEYVPRWRRVAHLIWALSIGDAATPGPVQLVRAALVRRRLNWRATRGALRGRLDGWRTYRSARRSSAASLIAIGHSSYGVSRARQLLGRRPGSVIVYAGHGARGVVRACRALVMYRAPVIYLVDVGMSTTVAALLGRGMGRRVVVDTGDLSYALARSVGGRSLLGLAAVALGERAILACAHHVVVRGRAHLDCVRGRPASVVPDLAPEEARQVSGDEIRELVGIPQHSFVVGLVGSLKWAPRLQRCYGWDLVEALAVTASDVHALIVGNGDGKRWLERRAAHLGVAERCHFAGYVAPEKIAEWVGAMDAAISTQTNDAVGAVRTTGKLPLYLACGCPVLASHVGEAARLLGPLGWTIPYAGTIDATYPDRLARAIESWRGDRVRHAQRRRAALRLAEEAFEPTDARAQIDAVLNSVTRRPDV
jgi:glycosyltransferase involved in cell wall biosynthesis